MTLAVLQDRPDPVVAESFPGGEGGKYPPVVAAQSAFGTEPEVPVAVQKDRRDLIVGQPVFGRKISEDFTIVTTHTSLGSNPEAPLCVLYDSGDFIVDEPILSGQVLERFAVETADARLGAKPEHPVPVLEYTGYFIVCQSVSGGVVPENSPVEAAHATPVTGEPEFAGLALQNRPHESADEAIGYVEGVPGAFPVHTVQFAPRACRRFVKGQGVPDETIGRSVAVVQGEFPQHFLPPVAGSECFPESKYVERRVCSEQLAEDATDCLPSCLGGYPEADFFEDGDQLVPEAAFELFVVVRRQVKGDSGCGFRKCFGHLYRYRSEIVRMQSIAGAAFKTYPSA